jgi:hypothetical protein
LLAKPGSKILLIFPKKLQCFAIRHKKGTVNCEAEVQTDLHPHSNILELFLNNWQLKKGGMDNPSYPRIGMDTKKHRIRNSKKLFSFLSPRSSTFLAKFFKKVSTSYIGKFKIRYFRQINMGNKILNKTKITPFSKKTRNLEKINIS